MTASESLDVAIFGKTAYDQSYADNYWEHEGKKYSFFDLDNVIKVLLYVGRAQPIPDSPTFDRHRIEGFQAVYAGDRKLLTSSLLRFHNSFIVKKSGNVAKEDVRLLYSFALAFMDKNSTTTGRSGNSYVASGHYYHQLVEKLFEKLDIAPPYSAEDILQKLPQLEAIAAPYEQAVRDGEAGSKVSLEEFLRLKTKPNSEGKPRA